MTEAIDRQQAHRLAHRVRDACIKAALDGYADAGISGLCAESRWEAAISGIEMLDVDAMLIAECRVHEPNSEGETGR